MTCKPTKGHTAGAYPSFIPGGGGGGGGTAIDGLYRYVPL